MHKGLAVQTVPAEVTERMQRHGLCSEVHPGNGIILKLGRNFTPFGSLSSARDILNKHCNLRVQPYTNAVKLIFCPSQLLTPTIFLDLPVLVLCQLYMHTNRIILGAGLLTGISTNVLLLLLMTVGLEMCTSVFGTTHWI